MSESLGLGKIITTPQSRDAIHVAVAPVVADENLSPGAWVGFTDKSKSLMGTFAEPIGIVDPFLKNIVIKGQKFWLYLQPGSIVSLKHEWLHPAFDEVEKPEEKPKKDQKKLAKAWLEDFFDKIGQDWDEAVSSVKHAVETGDTCICFGDDFSEYPEDDWMPEFWQKWYEFTGEMPSVEFREKAYFRCAC